MPLETIIVIASILVVFIGFAAVLAYADACSRSYRRAMAAAQKQPETYRDIAQNTANVRLALASLRLAGRESHA